MAIGVLSTQVDVGGVVAHWRATRSFGIDTERAKELEREMVEQRNDVADSMVAEEPKGDLTVRTLAMPADTNANGDIFGGWVLSQMDQAGGIAGVERARGRVVTIAVDAMTFIRPVKVGDVLCVYTSVEHVGRTSMKIHIEAWSRRFQTVQREKVTVATFTFVAIDDEGHPRPIPALERD